MKGYGEAPEHPTHHFVVGDGTAKAVISLTFFFEPRRNQLHGLESRAKLAGVENPQVDIQQTSLGFWRVKLTVPESERLFWLGFYSGMDYCVNNRRATTGTEN